MKIKSAVVAATLAIPVSLSFSALAQDNMIYGQPPVPGHYSAPPVNPQMMQQMMAAQQQKMQAYQQQMQEMQAQQQAEVKAQQNAMQQPAAMPAKHHKGMGCHHDKAGMKQAMQDKQAHMQRMEESLKNIEKLMQEMLNLMKAG